MLEIMAQSISDWLASGAVVFRLLLGVLVLFVLWEVATLLAVLIGWTGSEGASRRGRRPSAPSLGIGHRTTGDPGSE